MPNCKSMKSKVHSFGWVFRSYRVIMDVKHSKEPAHVLSISTEGGIPPNTKASVTFKMFLFASFPSTWILTRPSLTPRRCFEIPIWCQFEKIWAGFWLSYFWNPDPRKLNSCKYLFKEASALLLIPSGPV